MTKRSASHRHFITRLVAPFLLSLLACGGGGASEKQRTDPASAGPDAASEDASDVSAPSHPAADAAQNPPDAAVDAGGSRDSGGDAATPPGTDAGGTAIDSYPPKGDNDGDGLSNELERKLRTDPDRIDTDGDGVSDATELGADAAKPLDGDGDGFADALESTQLDNDRDGMPDQSDPASAGAWQVVFARVTPGVIANDGVDATTLELQLVGIEAQQVSVGMDAQFWFPLLAPDQLRVDGAALGMGRIDLFDDASHGDRIAGDGIFARGGITTTMKPRALPSTGPVTPRGEVTLGSVSLRANGTTFKRQLGYADGSDKNLFPGQFWVRFIEASAVKPVRSLAPDAQQTDHVLNIVDGKLALSVLRTLLGGETGADQEANALVALADRLPRQVDFMYLVSAVPSYGSLAGAHISLSNSVRGIGAEYNPPFPVDRGLSGLIVLAHLSESPIMHETMHQWGVYLDRSFGFDSASHHWGTAGTLGVLGGFRPGSLIQNPDGTFTVERFEPRGGTWTTTAFSDIELYLMGLLPAEQVAPIPVFINPTIVSGTDTTVTVQAQRQTIAIADIIAKHGARMPAAATAPKQFNAAFVLISERKLSAAELAFVDSRARAVETTTANETISFSTATRGLGSMRTSLVAP